MSRTTHKPRAAASALVTNYPGRMAVVKINAIEVPDGSGSKVASGASLLEFEVVPLDAA